MLEVELSSLVARPDHRPTGDIFETHLFSDFTEPVELFGPNILYDGQMVLGRSKVLAERDDINVNSTEILYTNHSRISAHCVFVYVCIFA